MKNNTVLVLKTVNANMTSAYDSSFVYPRQGMVSCPDWDPAPVCGHGLHGFLRGTGDGYLASWDSDAIWLVIRVNANDIVDLGGKIKFRCGKVIYAGDRKTATDMLKAAYPDAPVIGCISVAGDRGTATAGHHGTATAGHGGTATAGHHGTATAGDYGTATTGHHGTATVGDNGIATAGEGGIASAGKKGEIHIRWLEHANNRYRTAIGYVGEDGILPNVPYHVVNGKLTPKR